MKPVVAIQIDIPQPCGQQWGDMELTAAGRHCNSCNATVVDFTTWSDAELVRFFTEHKGHVCGRYLPQQLGRPIHIPAQPHSRLYRMVVALGLTLIFTTTQEAKGQEVPRPMELPDTVHNPAMKKADTVVMPVALRVKVVDGVKEPLVNASVAVYHDDKVVGGVATNFDGIAELRGFPAGSYKIMVMYIGYKTVSVQDVFLAKMDEASKTNEIIIDMKEGWGAVLGGPRISVKKHNARWYRRHR